MLASIDIKKGIARTMIIAKKLSVIEKLGTRTDYTHVTQVYTLGNFLTITAERDDLRENSAGRVNITDRYLIAGLETMMVDFYVPKE